ncbi:MAG: hypothetical protein KA314_04485 [Chloroflexi bacterium]|nr:hypothetical protein [Chloroflexota bacterium]
MGHYKIGFHAGVGGNRNGIGAWMSRMDAAAKPFFIKSVDDYGVCQEATQYTKANHTIVFRMTSHINGYNLNLPDYSLSPKAAAAKHWHFSMQALPPEFNKARVWLELINEVDKDRADWLGNFAVEIAAIANDTGYRVALFGWSAGEPEESHWELPGMLAYLRRCGARPHDCAVSIHEYSYNTSDIRDGWPYKIGRFAILFRVCDRYNIPRPRVMVTEWGWEHETVPSANLALVDMAWVADVYATYPDILGAALWYLGEGYGGIANRAQPLIAPSAEAAIAYRYILPDFEHDPAVPAGYFPPPHGVAGGGDPPAPLPTIPLARTRYTRITVLIHPSDGAPFAQAAAAASWQSGDPNLPHYFTIGASADDAGVAVLYEDLSHTILPIERHVIAVNPERWGPGEDGQGLMGFFEKYYAGVNYVPVAAASPQILAVILANFDPANPPTPPPPMVALPVNPILNQRDPRWASVVMGTGTDGKVKTLGNWGCLTVAYCMLAKQIGVSSLDPAQMWAHFKAKGATSGPNLLAAALETAFLDKVNYLGHQEREPGLIDRILNHIDSGYTVPARVDFIPATPDQWEQHWVLIRGYDPSTGRLRICDPWHGDEVWVDERYDITGDDVLEALFYERAAAPPPPDPPTSPAYKYNGPAVTFSPALHAPASDWEWALQPVQGLFQQVNLPVKWLSNGVSADHYARFNKPHFHLVRIFWKPDRKKTPAEAWEDVWEGVTRFYAKGARKFELHNEPNLTEEGWGLVWNTSAELGAWLREFAIIMRQACPQAQLYFPGMSPGVPWTNQFQVTNGAWPVCKDLMSGFCLHAYTGIMNDEVAAANEIINQVKEAQKYLNLQVPLVVSEASVNRGASAAYKATVYKRVEAGLRGVPGIEAVCWYISSWQQVPPEQAPHQEDWLKHGIGAAYATAGSSA